MKSKKKPDQHSPEYWEEQLQKMGLGTKELGLEDEFGPPENTGIEQLHAGKPQSDMDRLRTRMDGSEAFMTAHQIKKVRAFRKNGIPAWVLNDAEVRKVLLRSFPKLHTDIKQREAAGRWSRIIHLYYRMQMPNSQVAKEMGITVNVLKMALKHMRRVSRGRRSDNHGKLKHKPGS